MSEGTHQIRTSARQHNAAQAANMIETSNFFESDISLTIKLGDRRKRPVTASASHRLFTS